MQCPVPCRFKFLFESSSTDITTVRTILWVTLFMHEETSSLFKTFAAYFTFKGTSIGMYFFVPIQSTLISKRYFTYVTLIKPLWRLWMWHSVLFQAIFTSITFPANVASVQGLLWMPLHVPRQFRLDGFCTEDFAVLDAQTQRTCRFHLFDLNSLLFLVLLYWLCKGCMGPFFAFALKRLFDVDGA